MLWGVPQGVLDISNIQDFCVNVKKLANILRLAAIRDGGPGTEDGLRDSITYGIIC